MLAIALVGGCSADRPLNPLFPLTLGEAKAALHLMRSEPRPLERPVVVAGGIHDPGFVAQGIARTLRQVTQQDEMVISVSFFGHGAGTFDECRERLVDAVDRAFPTDDPHLTVEVDVIGSSMGGIVARHAARRRDDGGKRLRIRRLFTISTPHQGATMAALPTLDQRQIDMRPGSAFLAALNAEPHAADYDLHPYTRLGDLIVGPERSAPPGLHPRWVANLPLSFSHLGASHDPRILADIARRLRGERPFSSRPQAVTPETADSAAPPPPPPRRVVGEELDSTEGAASPSLPSAASGSRSSR